MSDRDARTFWIMLATAAASALVLIYLGGWRAVIPIVMLAVCAGVIGMMGQEQEERRQREQRLGLSRLRSPMVPPPRPEGAPPPSRPSR